MSEKHDVINEILLDLLNYGYSNGQNNTLGFPSDDKIKQTREKLANHLCILANRKNINSGKTLVQIVNELFGELRGWK